MKEVSATYLEDELAEERTIAECYHIWSDNLVSQYYTSDNEDVDAKPPGEGGSQTHTKAVIERDTVEWSSDLEVTTMKLKVANVQEPIVQYIANNPVEIIWIEVYRVHKEHPTETPSIIFMGHIQKIRFNGTSAEVSLVGFENYLKRIIPIYRYQKTCNNSLYDTKCKADKEDFDGSVTITDISNNNLTLSGTVLNSLYDNYFRYGYAEWDAPGTNALRRAMISKNTATTVTLSYKIDELEVGETVILYAGCDKQYTTCEDKFFNEDNFFGMPHLSYKNPTLL